MIPTFLILVLFIGGQLQAATFDSVIPPEQTIQDSSKSDSTYRNSLVIPSHEMITDQPLSVQQRYNPVKAIGLSALLPGAGQFYCQKKGRGLLFLTTESVFALYAINRLDNYKNILSLDVKNYTNKKNLFLDSLSLFTQNVVQYQTLYSNFIEASMNLDLARYRQKSGQYSAYQATGWLVGLYLWNIADAMKCSNYFTDDQPRSPAVAAWLSAVPYLGLGQIYNGSFTKAGLIWTTHTMLTVMSYNYNRLLNNCVNKRHQVESSLSVSSEQKKYL